MGAFSPAEQDALAKVIFTAVCQFKEHYDAKGSESGKWITIGGGSGPGGEQHAGGTPVKLGPGGKIEAGPKALEGKPIAAVDGNKEERPAWHGFKEEAEAEEKAGNYERAARRWNDAAENHPGGPEADELRRRGSEAAAGNKSTPPADKPAPQTDNPPSQADNGPPSVSAAHHAEVKEAVGDKSALVAYYRNGAYHFLHDDAAKASGVLGSTSVPHKDFRAALNKLVAGGHRVAVAEPEGEKAPRQTPVRQPKPEPALPAIDQPSQARQAGDHQQAPGAGASSKPEAIPPGRSAGKPPAMAAKSAPEVQIKESGQGKLFDHDGSLRLKLQKVMGETPKATQKTLFDKLSALDAPKDSQAATEPAKSGSSGAPQAKDVEQPEDAPAAASSPHRLQNKLGEKPPAGVKVLNNGQWSGSAQLHVNDIHLDPHRFQYKISGIDQKTGVTKELSESSKFNPDLAGRS